MKATIYSGIIFATGWFAATSLPAHANTAFDLFTPAGATNSVGNSTSLIYTVSGATLTFQNPTGSNSPQLQKNPAGICAYMTFIGGGASGASVNLDTTVPFCGQNTTTSPLNTSTLNVGTYTPSTLPASQILNSIKFKFDKEVILKSFTVAAADFQNPTPASGTPSPGQVGTGTVSLTPKFSNPDSGDFTSSTITMSVVRNTGSNVNFTNSSSSANCVGDSGTSRCTIGFPANYTVKAGTLVTVTTPSFSGVSTEGTYGSLANPGGHWRLYSINAQIVPGPLPLIGWAVAMGWSRRLRQRIAATKQNQVALSD